MANMKTVVQKYGGSSVATLERIEMVARSIKETARDNGVVAVVSAMGRETDRLIKLAQEVSGGLPPRDELDKLLVTGEEQSAPLLVMALRRLGLAATSLTGRAIELEADSAGRAKRIRNADRITRLLSQGQIVVVAGFQGIIEGTDEPSTLGRGGSDLTAIAIAGALGLGYCEIYTDVDGVFMIDPRIVPGAKRFVRISYSQMIQLSGAGAGVLMDRSVALAQNLGVEIRVLLSPSLGESSGGTLVCSGSSLEEMEGFGTQPGVAVQRMVQIKISGARNSPGVAGGIFGALSDVNIVDSAQVPGAEEADIALLCLPEDSPRILARLQEARKTGLVGEIGISEPLGVAGLTLVDPTMKEEPGRFGKVFGAIGNAGVNIEMFSSSGTTILTVVREEDLEKAARALGKEFDLLS